MMIVNIVLLAVWSAIAKVGGAVLVGLGLALGFYCKELLVEHMEQRAPVIRDYYEQKWEHEGTPTQRMRIHTQDWVNKISTVVRDGRARLPNSSPRAS